MDIVDHREAAHRNRIIGKKRQPPKRGPLLYGAWHVHNCKCGRVTTGAGESLCPHCATENIGND